jgi:Mg-chelatase subunit ChlD
MMIEAFTGNWQPATGDSLLASAFITPWFFAAGAVLTAIPIIIHLLNRRRFKVVQWAAMEYLLQAMRKNRRRLKFEQWLLLATRCALLVLLGIALARPLGCENNTLASLAGQRNGLHVFILDNSYSMAYEADRAGAKTHFDQAKLLAKGIMDRVLRGGESILILTAARPAGAVIAKPTYSLDACHAAVDSIEQSYTGTDLSSAVAKATELARDEMKQPNKYLYLMTDGTRSAFEGTQAEALKSSARDAQSVFGDADHIHLFNLGRADQWNQAVLDLKPLGNLITTKFSADFSATVRGFGNGTDPLLQWQIDGKETSGGGLVKLGENAAPVLLPNKPIREGGPHIITATVIGDDRLRLDNSRSRIVNVASEIKVLVVDGERSSQGLSGSGSFLELALAPLKSGSETAGAKSDSPMSPRVIGDQDLGDKEVLGQYRAVILTNVGHIPEGVADQLQAFVDQGGVLMLFMGPRVDGEDYNRVLLTEKRHLLPGKLVEKISAANVGKDAFLFDFKPEGELPVYLNVFKGEANSGLGTARIFQYWRLNLTDPSAERVLNYVPAGQSVAGPTTGGSTTSAPQSSDPAITVHASGKGRVIYFSTTANADWTTFPAKPAYVTLVNELLAGTITPGDAWMNLTVGESIEVPTNLGLSAAPTLTDSAKKDIPVFAVTTTDGQMFYRSPPLNKPGVYHLSTGNAAYPIAVNVPTDEADVRTLPEAGIRKALGEIPFTLHGDQFTQESAAQLNSGRDLGWSVMLAVLALAAFECFVAMRFGHHRRGSTN